MSRLAVVALTVVVVACAPAQPAAPTIARFDPASGPPGTTVVVIGTNLTDTREVSFAGSPAAIVAVGSTRVLVKVPTDASTGPIAVRTTSTTLSFDESFVVLPASVTAAAPDPTAPPPMPTRTGYSALNVPTSRGTFAVHLIKEPLADVSVRTLTANQAVCRSDCPVKPLDDYVRDAGGFAGMNGTYLCPPDYAECATKVNSYDYAVYNSQLATWLNRPALVGQNALAVFNGATATFYRRAYVYAQSAASRAPLTAAISNYPLLVEETRIVDSEREQSPNQKARNTKGAIGADGTYVYLALIANASVTDAAYAMQALGARDALNLDGGGTSAMWFDGGYKVGPGRLLPNAIVLTQR